MTDDWIKEYLQREADLRRRPHDPNDLRTDRTDPGRPILHDGEEIGMAGEWAFAMASGIMPVALSGAPGGTGGVDFEVPLMFTVDIKASPHAGNLIVTHPVADIYVLAKVDGWDAEFVGWCWGAELRKAPQSTFGRDDREPAHFINSSKLKPMSKLWKRISSIRRKEG